MPIENFLKPKLKGARFDGGVVPLHVLADFAVLEQMIVDVAKWKYLSENTKRKRVPRGFTDGITLKLTGIEDGSAIPLISLFFAATTLLQPTAVSYYEDARTSIVTAIREANQNQPITVLPPTMLGYFGKFGKSLEPGESVEFDNNDGKPPAILNQESRHRLVLASSVKEYISDIVLHGAVPEMDQRNNQFQIQCIDGTVIRAPLSAPYFDTVMEAFNSYSTLKKVRVYAIGMFDRDQKLKNIELVEHVVPIDPLDIRVRIDELKQIKSGWLDGIGGVPPKDHLDWIAIVFENYFPDDLKLPYLFLLPDSTVQAEWLIGRHSITLEIDTTSQSAFWHEMNLDTDQVNERQLNLKLESDWVFFTDALRSLGGVAE